MEHLHIMVSRHSAFYSPLIASVAGGFLETEGLDASYAKATPDNSVPEGLANGSVDVGQLAVSASWGFLQRGVEPHFVHFAQINECDGFFLNKRGRDAGFSWDELAGSEVLVDHLGQPMAMFKFAALKMGLDLNTVDVIDCGEPDEMDQCFRDGVGDFIHQQGPAPQQLEHDGVGRVVAALGNVSGPLAFSSLSATREWLASDAASAFMRAYHRARQFVIDAPAREIADMEQSFFSGIDIDVLTATISSYQKLGCWTPEVNISRLSYNAALEVFKATGGVDQDHPYEAVVVDPPRS